MFINSFATSEIFNCRFFFIKKKFKCSSIILLHKFKFGEQTFTISDHSQNSISVSFIFLVEFDFRPGTSPLVRFLSAIQIQFYFSYITIYIRNPVYIKTTSF